MYLSSKSELRKAISSKERTIIATGKLAHDLKPFAKKSSSNISSNMSKQALTGSLVASGIGIPVRVIIALIVALGLLILIAMLKEYDITYKDKDREIILKRKD